MARLALIAFKAGPVESKKLDQLVAECPGKNRSEILRALILAAKREHLPRAWLEIAEDERELVVLAEGRE
jgi:hypothetical protein